jgi:hypothetical protein
MTQRKVFLKYSQFGIIQSSMLFFLNLFNLKKTIVYFIPKNYPIVGVGDPISIRLNDSMNRPSDYGVFERLEILNELSKEAKKR